MAANDEIIFVMTSSYFICISDLWAVCFWWARFWGFRWKIMMMNEETPTFIHLSGILASYIASKEARKAGLMTMVPSIANLRSHKLSCTSFMTLCMRSSSCLKSEGCHQRRFDWKSKPTVATWRKCSSAEKPPCDSRPHALRMHCILVGASGAYPQQVDKQYFHGTHHPRRHPPWAGHLISCPKCLKVICQMNPHPLCRVKQVFTFCRVYLVGDVRIGMQSKHFRCIVRR